MTRKIILVIAALMFSLGFFLSGCGGGQGKGKAAEPQKEAGAKAETPAKAVQEAKFPSKDVTYIVPYGAGGGFDTYSRILAPFLEKNLPKKANVVVQNVTGAGGIVGIMQVYKANPDGHTIGIFNLPGNAIDQILGRAEYDLNKISWIGIITDSPYVMAISPKSKYKKLEDLQKATEVKAGIGGGLSSTAGLNMAVSAAEMGFKVKMINYDSSQEAILAALRGDVDLVNFVYPSIKKYVVDSKDLLPLWVYTKTRMQTLPDTPTVSELGYQQLLASGVASYVVGATPGVPENALKVWRETFNKSTADPEFRKMMANTGQEANPSNYEKASQAVKDGLKNLQSHKSLFEQYMPKKK